MSQRPDPNDRHRALAQAIERAIGLGVTATFARMEVREMKWYMWIPVAWAALMVAGCVYAWWQERDRPPRKKTLAERLQEVNR
jgi:hypothetical protein